MTNPHTRKPWHTLKCYAAAQLYKFVCAWMHRLGFKHPRQHPRTVVQTENRDKL